MDRIAIALVLSLATIVAACSSAEPGDPREPGEKTPATNVSNRVVVDKVTAQQMPRTCGCECTMEQDGSIEVCRCNGGCGF